MAAHPPVDRAFDGGSAPLVALHGHEAMADADLRTAMFERPSLPKIDGREIRRRRREAERADPYRAAYNVRNTMGGVAAVGLFDGVGDGGGGGGGDGG
jgi:hypothetical protein